MSYRRVDGRGRYGNEYGNSLVERERDEPMREEGLQARGAYKEVPRASRRLALATPKSPQACTRVRDKRSLTIKVTLSIYIKGRLFLNCYAKYKILAILSSTIIK